MITITIVIIIILLTSPLPISSTWETGDFPQVMAAPQGARQTKEIYLVVQEEVPTGYLVADLLSSAGFKNILPMSVVKNLRFQFLTQPLPVDLSLEEETGVLRTSGRLDREVLCPGEDSCKVSFGSEIIKFGFILLFW